MIIATLSRQSGVSEANLRWLAETASKRYKVYDIPKRNGGTRRISHPSREIKAIQRWINRSLLANLPVHTNATAYAPGSSIKKNATAHARTRFTLRIDFKDFFPSFTRFGIIDFLRFAQSKYSLQINEDDIIFISKVMCRNDSLTIGAPSSPVITNAIMYEFDQAVSHACDERGLIYTRYADDLFISTTESGGFKGIEALIGIISDNFTYAKLQINSSKTAYLSMRNRRIITGLIITPDHQVSLGRARKREIKSLIFRFISQKLEIEEIFRLKGLVAFAKDVEPSFYTSLVLKYGVEALIRVNKHFS